MLGAVNAIYDYAAAGPEEFSFSQGDVIAVVETDVGRIFREERTVAESFTV
mgnify:FL=1